MYLTNQAIVKYWTALLLIDGIVGLLLVPLGSITASWQGVLINVLIGVLGGYVQVAVFTWIQQRVRANCWAVR